MKRLFQFVLMLLFSASLSAAGAPQRLLVVAQDGTGDYTSIQEAIYAIRDYTPEPITVFIKNGVYREKLIIPSWKCDITLRGESVENTIITCDDYAGKMLVYFGAMIEKMGTFRSHTLLVAGHRITLENLTIENTAGRVGQAVALHTEGDGIVIRNCRLKAIRIPSLPATKRVVSILKTVISRERPILFSARRLVGSRVVKYTAFKIRMLPPLRHRKSIRSATCSTTAG